MVSRARIALREWVKANGGQARAGRVLGVSQPTVCNWLNGVSEPDGDNKDVIELRCAIPRAWWKTPYDPQQHKPLVSAA